MKEQLLEAWRTNNKVNLLFIDNVDEEGLEKTLSPKGRTILLQLAHMHNVRLNWLEVASTAIFNNHKKLDVKNNVDKQQVRNALLDSGKAIEEFIMESWENNGKVKGFKKGLIPFIAYLIAHDSHHRGNAMLTLKQSGIKLSDKLKWGMWEWDKI